MAIRSSSTLLIALFVGLSLTGCEETVKGDTGLNDTGGATGPVDYDDADGDTIIDIHDGEEDFDGDGTPNYLDLDSDGDGIKDRVEAGDDDPYTMPIDSDGDGDEDFLDLDSDNNGISDSDEKNATGSGPGDMDGDGTYDFRDPDNDGDGIKDVYEIGGDASNPVDFDGDGTPDYMDIDSDGDGIGDLWEGGITQWNEIPLDTDGDGVYDYHDHDTDGDTLPDSEEGGVTDGISEPRDTDGDGIYDFRDTDSDGDGLSDYDEVHVYGTDPYDWDTDGDGQSDGAEVLAGTDPLDPTSKIEGIYIEVPERTEVEEQFLFELSIQMGDVAFLIDTTGSMGSTANAMASEFGNIVVGLSSVIDDMAYGFATYDDYAYGNYGSSSSGDRPFILQQQVTTDTALIQAALNACPNHYGADGPESTMEAIYQAATGAGYDQACTGRFDTSADVLPFISSPSDPFGGTSAETYDATTPGAGTKGGMGFRDYALPIIVYATDAQLRDPEAGYGSPGGCHLDAAKSHVVTAVSDIGAYLIGVAARSSSPTAQMTELAHATGSYADTDGDGVADDPLVFSWSSSDTAFRTLIIDAVDQLVASVRFDRVELEIEGDDYGFVIGIEPEYYSNIDPDEVEGGLPFTLHFRGVVAATTNDQLFNLTLNVIGDGTTLLDSYDILVVVPGTSY